MNSADEIALIVAALLRERHGYTDEHIAALREQGGAAYAAARREAEGLHAAGVRVDPAAAATATATTAAPVGTPDRMVFREHGKVTETCSYGQAHEVVYVEAVNLFAIGETRVHDNGYEKRETPLFVDQQGRIYHQHVAIDYFNNISYRRDGDGVRFVPSLRGKAIARDLLGRGLDGAPDGPAWSPATEGR